MYIKVFIIGFVLGALGAAGGVVAGAVVGYKTAKEEFGNLDNRLDGIEHYASDAANHSSLTYYWTLGKKPKIQEEDA